MARITVEDSLKQIEGADRFKLIHEAVKLAKSAAAVETKHKPAVWALKAIAEGNYTLPSDEESASS
jgi:DNA-directed RNA polymerase omega subunit